MRMSRGRSGTAHGLGSTAQLAGKQSAAIMNEDAQTALTALIEEAESRPGSSMYCKVTTYELRKALGQDVTDWPKRSEA